MKLAIREQEEYFLKVFNRHFEKGSFPKVWKDSRLVLIEKPKKEGVSKSSYRPICLINNIGKTYERLINQRLIVELKRGEGLSEAQFDFRKSRSTTGAIGRITEIAQDINKGPYKSRKSCVLVTLDIQNAFNSAPWKGVIKALHKKRISAYLIRVLKAYLNQRTLKVGERSLLNMTCGEASGVRYWSHSVECLLQ